MIVSVNNILHELQKRYGTGSGKAVISNTNNLLRRTVEELNGSRQQEVAAYLKMFESGNLTIEALLELVPEYSIDKPEDQVHFID